MSMPGPACTFSTGRASVFSRTIARAAPKESRAILFGNLHSMPVKLSRLSKLRSLVLRATGGGTVTGGEEHQFISTQDRFAWMLTRHARLFGREGQIAELLKCERVRLNRDYNL
jgi:hypothetical protein